MDIAEQNLSSRRSTPPIKQEVKLTGSIVPYTRNPVKEEVVVEEKIFDANELRNYLKPVWDKIYDADEALPFRIPVDPHLLKIPVKIFNKFLRQNFNFLY